MHAIRFEDAASHSDTNLSVLIMSVTAHMLMKLLAVALVLVYGGVPVVVYRAFDVYALC